MGTMFRDYIVGRIPDDWTIDRIAGLLSEEFSGTWGPENANGVSVLRSTNFQNNGYLNLDSVAVREIPENHLSNKAINIGDILLERSGGGPQQPVGRVSWCDDRVTGWTFSNFCQILRPSAGVDSKFLFYALYYLHMSSITLTYQNQTTGIRNLEYKSYLRISIPLPPLPEQRKIAEILSTVDEAIEKTDATIEETQQLKKGLMQKLFTEGIGHTRFRKTILADVEKPIAQRGHQLEQFRILPQDWDIVRCGKVFSLEYGKGLTESERDGGDFPVVGSAGIVGHHSQKLTVGPGMVVGRKGGAGIVTHVKDDFWPIDTTYFVKLKGKHDVDWLYYILNFLKLTRLGEGTVPGLNRTDVYHLYIPLPPLPEQRQIGEILSEVDSKIETEHAFKSELEQLKKGLMQVLLTGKVRVKV